MAPRVETPVNKPKGLTTREKRVQKAQAGLNVGSGSPARRGEDDDATGTEGKVREHAEAEEAIEVTEDTSSDGVPHQANAATRQVVEPSLGDVSLSGEQGEGASLQFTPAPEDMDPLEHIAHVKRGIGKANDRLTRGAGKLERDYVLTAGEWLWEATERKSYKAAGFKSVEKFAHSVGLERHDVYRLRKAVPVYRDVGDLVEEPLGSNTIEELYRANAGQDRRDTFIQMKKMGRINAAGAKAARKLLATGSAQELIESEPGTVTKPPVIEQLNSARKTNRVVRPEVLKEIAEEDREAAVAYVKEMRELIEAGAKAIGEA